MTIATLKDPSPFVHTKHKVYHPEEDEVLSDGETPEKHVVLGTQPEGVPGAVEIRPGQEKRRIGGRKADLIIKKLWQQIRGG